MTHPSDIAGLSERLRERVTRLGDSTPHAVLNFMNGILPLLDEAAAALDSLSARVKELEAELFDTQATLGGVNRDWNKAMDRALRAEHQRAKAYERAAKVAEQFGEPYALNTNTGAMMFRAVTEKIAAAIRRLASPPQEPL